MQKATKYLLVASTCAAVLSAVPAFAQTSSAKDSVVTVEQLLRLDNAQAREKANRELASTGLTSNVSQADQSKKQLATKMPPPRASLAVTKIMGVGQSIRAEINYNGLTQKDVVVGSPVGACTVASISGQCVTLAPKLEATAGDAKSKKKGTPGKEAERRAAASNMCPSACWTGAQPADLSRPPTISGAPGTVSQAISGPVLPPPGVPSYVPASPMQPPVSPMATK